VGEWRCELENEFVGSRKEYAGGRVSKGREDRREATLRMNWGGCAGWCGRLACGAWEKAVEKGGGIGKQFPKRGGGG